MFEIDIEIHVEAPGHSDESFMDFVIENLYHKYEGDLNPGIRSGQPYISCTVEAQDDKLAKAIYSVLNDLEAIGLKIKRIEVCSVYDLA